MNCREESKQAPPKQAEIPWGGFGEQGANRISVVMIGNIKHPGNYHLSPEATLESAFNSAGGSAFLGEMTSRHTKVRIMRTIDGKPSKVVYSIQNPPGQSQDPIALKNGDVLDFLESVF